MSFAALSQISWLLQEKEEDINHSTHIKSSTSLLHTPASITAWIFMLGPSDKYAIAQHASANTSGSLWNSKRASVGKHGDT